MCRNWHQVGKSNYQLMDPNNYESFKTQSTMSISFASCKTSWLTTCTIDTQWSCKPSRWIQALDNPGDVKEICTMRACHRVMHTSIKWHTVHFVLDSLSATFLTKRWEVIPSTPCCRIPLSLQYMWFKNHLGIGDDWHKKKRMKECPNHFGWGWFWLCTKHVYHTSFPFHLWNNHTQIPIEIGSNINKMSLL